MRRPSILLPLLALVLSGCAGKEVAADAPPLKSPPLDVGHGSVEEVADALAAQGIPCTAPRPSTDAPAGLEQATECDLQPSGERVLLVHFFDVPGSQAFEEAEQAADRPGVYADTWAARTRTPQTAALLAKALRHRSVSADA